MCRIQEHIEQAFFFGLRPKKLKGNKLKKSKTQGKKLKPKNQFYGIIEPKNINKLT